MPIRHPMVRVKVSRLRVECQHVVDDPERKLPAGSACWEGQLHQDNALIQCRKGLMAQPA